MKMTEKKLEVILKKLPTNGNLIPYDFYKYILDKARVQKKTSHLLAKLIEELEREEKESKKEKVIFN